MTHKTSTLMITAVATTVGLLGGAYGQTPQAPFTDGSSGPAATRTLDRPPTIRGDAILDAFKPENTQWLPAVTEVAAPTAQNPPVVGRVQEVRIDSGTQGRWTGLGEDDVVWTMAIASPNAPSLRLRIEPFSLPPGGEVVIYNAKDPREAYGPYTASPATGAPFWAPAVFGSEVRVELYLPPHTPVTLMPQGLLISGVAQALLPAADDTRGCRIDVTCDTDWADEALAVAYIEFISGGSVYSCTGSMVNRLNGDFAPIFLTAGHCISTEAEANTLQAWWFYQTSVCNGAAPPLSSCPTTVGATLLAVHPAADNTIMGLTGTYPSGLYWLGWDSAAIPNPTDGVLLHHPSGTRKAISYGVYEGRDDNHCVAPTEIHYRLDLSDGGQEHGSSGGPGFDPDHRVRTVATCSADPGCDPSEDTWEGSFHDAYSTLSPFLNPQLDVWVDAAYVGTETGTEAQPWNTIIEGYFGVRSTGTIHIQADDYPPVTLRGSRSMRLVAEGGTVRIGM